VSKPTCYMCDAFKATREHAPPLCLFPEISDTPDKRDYRKNLITVPACEEHNLRSHLDDEYLRAVLLHGYANGPAAGIQIQSKMARAMAEKPFMFKALYKNLTPIVVDGVETAAIDIDVARFDRTIDKVIRAVYFHEIGEKLRGRIQVHSQFLLTMHVPNADADNARVLNYVSAVTHALKLANAPRCGSNQEVFSYQLVRDPGRPIVYGRFVFYEGFDVFFHSQNQLLPEDATVRN
jgi:hypothetical protein